LAVSPWYTLILDLAAVAALMVFRPRPGPSAEARHARARLAAVGVIALAAGVSSAVLMATYRPARLSQAGEILGDQRWVMLEPHTWQGKRLPLLEHIDVGKRLSAGRWTVLLYHQDCPSCRETIGDYEKRARGSGGQAGGRIALIEMPPYGPHDESPIPKDTRCLVGKLSDARDWFAATPVELVLAGGKVVSVRDRSAGAEVVAGQAESPSWRDVPRVAVTGPKWTVEHRLGFVKPDSLHRVIFVLKNPSDGAIAIKSSQSECVCMRVAAAPDAIPANSSAEVRVTFEAPKKATSYSKRVVLTTGEKSVPRIVLRVSARVGMPLEVTPSMLDLGTVAAGVEAKGNLTIVNRGDKPVRLLYGTSNWLECVARVPASAIPPGGRLSVPVVVRPGKSAAGRRSATLNIQTDCANQPRIAVRVKCLVKPQDSAAAKAG
ncbi:hypothetical protein LCGC14_2412010, partial [marine sediment metagenome]